MTRPNVVVILADDLGFSDLGCYGGEIPTPNLDALGRKGVRMTQFYNTARCSPSRASLLTGRHPHETGVGILTEDGRPDGYPGTLSAEFPTLAERLRTEGYTTCLSGKWHLSADVGTPNDSWPTRRGFDEFYGILAGAGDYFHPRGLYHGETRLDPPGDDYYLTDAISDHAADFVRKSAGTPFFLYLAYTAPHWPLHAPEDAVVPHERTYAAGWDELRAQRLNRLRAEGILGDEAALSPRDAPDWAGTGDKEWQARRMAVYAAQVELMDRGIGRVLDALGDRLDDTLVVFLSDNGGCAEELPPPDAPHFLARQPSATPAGAPIRLGNRPGIRPGPHDTYASYGQAWANLSNTPFRRYKRWVHEGGIATPFIAHWPAGQLIAPRIDPDPCQLTDIVPTILDAVGVRDDTLPGRSMVPGWRGAPTQPHPLFWEHIGNAGVREGRWKAVREADGPWELYDLEHDRSELDDKAGEHPELVTRLGEAWEEWAASAGVVPWARIREQGA